MSEFIDYIWFQKDFTYDSSEGLTFSTYHLNMMAITIGLFLVVWTIGHQLNKKQRFLSIISMIMLILEVLRVVNFKYAYNRSWIASISFHMCSFGVYMAVFTGIFKKKWMYDAMALQAIIGAPLALFIPIGILPWFNPYSFMPIQSFVIHMLLCFMPIFAWYHRLWQVKLKHYYIAVLSVFISTGIAYAMSVYNQHFQNGGFTNFFWTRRKESFFDDIWALPYPYYLIVLIGVFLLTGLLVYIILMKYQPKLHKKNKAN